MFKNATAKLLSLLVAVVLWAQVAGHQNLDRVVEMPLSLVGLPDSLVVRGAAVPDAVEVRVRSSKLQLFLHDMLRRGRGRCEVNLAGAGPGAFRHRVTVSDVRTDATALAIEPPLTLDVMVHRRVSRSIPVRVVLQGSLPEGITLAGRPAVIPAEITVTGPAPLVAALDHVNTRAIKVGRRRRSFTEMARLEPTDADLVLRPLEVEVSLGIDEIVERVFEGVPIAVLSDLEGVRIVVDPEFAQVRVTGPARDVNNLAPQDVAVVIPIGDRSAGVYQLEPQVVAPDAIISTIVDPPGFQVIVGAEVEGTGEGASTDDPANPATGGGSQDEPEAPSP